MQPLLSTETGTGTKATRSPRQQSLAQQKADLDEEARVKRRLAIVTAYALRLTAYALLPTPYCLRLTAYCLLLTAYCVQLTSHHSPLTTYYDSGAHEAAGGEESRARKLRRPGQCRQEAGARGLRCGVGLALHRGQAPGAELVLRGWRGAGQGGGRGRAGSARWRDIRCLHGRAER